MINVFGLPAVCSCRLPPDLHALTRSETRGPGPLEVIASELTGHVYHFTDEVESGHISDFHRLR